VWEIVDHSCLSQRGGLPSRNRHVEIHSTPIQVTIFARLSSCVPESCGVTRGRCKTVGHSFGSRNNRVCRKRISTVSREEEPGLISFVLLCCMCAQDSVLFVGASAVAPLYFSILDFSESMTP
jgi:hypothetical protein